MTEIQWPHRSNCFREAAFSRRSGCATALSDRERCSAPLPLPPNASVITADSTTGAVTTQVAVIGSGSYADSQLWEFVPSPAAAGHYYIVSKLNGYVLSATAASSRGQAATGTRPKLTGTVLPRLHGTLTVTAAAAP